MTSRPATLAAAICIAATVSGCVSLQSATLTALGMSGKEEREAARLQRAERAAHLSDEEIDRRVDFLTERLDKRQLHAALWKYGWLTVNGGGLIVSATQAGLADEGSTDQVNEIAQAGKAAIGVAYLLLNPMPGTSGADPVRELPNVTREDRLARLAEAEYILAREAERAHDRTSWLLHLGNLFLDAAAAAPALALGDAGLAAESFGIGAAVGEIQIWSQPWKGPSDWEEYEHFIATGEDLSNIRNSRWWIAPRGLGLAFVAEF